MTDRDVYILNKKIDDHKIDMDKRYKALEQRVDTLCRLIKDMMKRLDDDDKKGR
jgi:hypothetical protein